MRYRTRFPGTCAQKSCCYGALLGNMYGTAQRAATVRRNTQKSCASPRYPTQLVPLPQVQTPMQRKRLSPPLTAHGLKVVVAFEEGNREAVFTPNSCCATCPAVSPDARCTSGLVSSCCALVPSGPTPGFKGALEAKVIPVQVFCGMAVVLPVSQVLPRTLATGSRGAPLRMLSLTRTREDRSGFLLNIS